jgi:probable F420-dependent oxidoreductase
MAAIKVGVHLPPQRTSYAEYRQAWLRADALGVDSIWNWDHFFPLTTLLSDPSFVDDGNGAHFEAWTTVAVLGTEVKHAQVGCLVHSMSYRNPALLSAMAKTLDHATEGRFVLGVGAGWVERDYADYGYAFGTASERLRNWERGLTIIKERWATDQPPPLRGTIPIMVAGVGEKVTLRIAAQHADLWNGFGPVENWTQKNRVLDEWCAALGRDPAAIERTVVFHQPRDLDAVDDFVAAGATHLIYRPGMQAPLRFDVVEHLLAWRDRRNAGAA